MVNLPSKLSVGPAAFPEFDQVVGQLIEGWELRRQSAEALPPAESAAGYLKRECYRIIIHYLTKGSASFFERVIRRDGRALTSRVKLEENPFHFGMLALFADDSVVSRQDRSSFAMQMLYAYHHSVPPKFLIGFIYQVGSKEEIRRKLAEGLIEPGFESTYKFNIEDVRIVPL
jgi:hypothetical protein